MQLREFCLFQYIIFMFQNTISQSKHKFASEHLRRNKQNMSVFGKILYCIRKYFIMWDVQSHKCGDQAMIWKVGACKSSEEWMFVRGRKNKKIQYFFASVIVLN